MNLRLITLAALAAITSAAQAAPVSWADPGLLRINLGGATALRNSVASLVTNDLCGGTATNPDIRFYNTNGLSTFNGNHWAVTCPLPVAGAARLGVAVGTPFALVKSDAGGSAQGVFPIATGNPRPFMNPGNCTGTAPNFTCSGTVDAPMHLGVSDVEPAMFVGQNVPDDSADPDVPAYSPSGPDTTGMTIAPVVQTIFTVAVNRRLYNDMFAKQGLGSKRDAAGNLCTTDSSDETCIPSIGRGQARSFFQGTEGNWRLLSANSGLVNSQVNICRRVNGSGTQAAANLFHNEFPCNPSTTPVSRWFDSSSPAPRESSPFLNTMADGTSFTDHLLENIPGITAPNSDGGLFVFEGPGTGNVTACLTRAQTAGGYGVGHVSRENAEAPANWKFLRTEKSYPNRDSAKNGEYDYMYESTMQYKAANLSGLVAVAVPNLVAELRRPDALSRLSANAQAGVAALPSSYTGAYGSGTANEIAFGSRVTRAGNSCQPLSATK